MHLCFAVIRAKAVSKKEVDSGNDIYGNPIKRIQYEIKQIKVTVAVLGLLCPAEPWEVTRHPIGHPLEPEELQPPTHTSLLYEEHSQTLWGWQKGQRAGKSLSL